MTLSEQDLEWLATVNPHCPYLWIMPWRREMQFKAQDATNRFDIFTFRLLHPEEAAPRTRLSGSVPSLEILWRDNFLVLILITRPQKFSCFLSCNIEVTGKGLYAILYSYAFNCTGNFKTNHMAVSLPSRKNKSAASQYAHCLVYETYRAITTVTKESQSFSFWSSFTKSLSSSAPYHIVYPF